MIQRIATLASVVLILSCQGPNKGVVRNSTTITGRSVPEEVIGRIFQIRFGEESGGTCVGFSIDSIDYLITARHLFPDAEFRPQPLSSKVGLEIFRDGKWNLLGPLLLVHPNPLIDIAILKLNTNNFKSNPFDIGGEFRMTQQCFFLGFPYGDRTEDINNLHSGFPMPFAKMGVISGRRTRPENVIFVDAFANPGFSGGPLLMLVDSNDDLAQKARIVGIVTQSVDEYKQIKTQSGNINFQMNAGLVRCFSTDYISEILIMNRN